MVKINTLDYSRTTVMCIYSADMMVNLQYGTYLQIFMVLVSFTQMSSGFG